MPNETPAAATHTILLIDDDASILETYKLALESEGFAVISAGDGEAGLAQAKAQRPSVIILDLMMPKMDGQEFLKAIKQDNELKAIPIIVCSALIPDLEKDKVLALGAAEYLLKTDVDPNKLVTTVRSHIKE